METPITTAALNAVAKSRDDDSAKEWQHYDPLIQACVKLEMDRARLLEFVRLVSLGDAGSLGAGAHAGARHTCAMLGVTIVK